MSGESSKSAPTGCPMGQYDSKKTPLNYNNYLKVRELKQLQFCQSNPAHHDEPLFIIIHQTYELWFKLILHEIDEAVRLIEANEVRKATWFMRRIIAIFRVLVGQIHILETMSPKDFMGFRSSLNPASGFQSSQFREIEIACGLRDKALLEHFRQDAESWPELERRTQAKSLRDCFNDLLRRNGFDMPEAPDSDSEGLNADELKTAETLESKRIQELRKIYETDDYPDFHDLAETLVDLDEQIALWRTHHVTVVERVIGFRRGTGGSEGVNYLRSTLSKRCFSDLWKVRTALEV